MQISDNKEKQQAMDLAEDSREQVWRASFVAELFKGNFRWDLIHPYPTQSEEDRLIGDALLVDLEAVLRATIDPEAVDRTQEVPKAALKALADKGYFGMKIAKEYGGSHRLQSCDRGAGLRASWRRWFPCKS
jgi:alkylation response protein AidB-like acyl-CoA dehydrogenase